MTREELIVKIADIESMVDDKYHSALKDFFNYRCECIAQKKVVMKTEPQRSTFERQAQISINRLKKEYAMQTSPADIGDVIEAEIKIDKAGSVIREIVRMMRVERIEVAAFEEPQLTFYGTYVKQDGVTPYSRQMNVPIYQKDIIRVVKAAKH